MSTDAQLNPPQSPRPLPRRGKSSALQQAVAIQRNLYRIAIDTTLPPKDCASAALAWERLEERKRILRGRPMPGSLRPVSEKKTKNKPTVIEPT